MLKKSFINKGMDIIDLPSIFRGTSVQSSMPNYFKNRIVKYQSFVINIINLLGVQSLISINLFLILILKLVYLPPETARTLNILLRVV